MKNILLFALFFGAAVTNNAQAQDGTPDLSFGVNGVLTFPSPYSMQITYGVNGEFYVLEGPTIGRYLPSGILDNSYGTNGHTLPIPMIIATIAVQHDGKVLAGGYTNPPSGANPYDEMVARFNTDGTLDLTWGNQGYISRSYNGQSIDAVTQIVAGKNYIVVLGYGRDPVEMTFANDITIYNLAGGKTGSLPAGDLYQNLDPGNIFPSSFEFRIEFDNDKVILLTSNHTQTYSSPDSPDLFDNTLIRYNPDGSPDPSFDQTLSEPILKDYAIYDMIVTSDHKIIYNSSKYHPDADFVESVMTRINADGSIDGSFGVNGRQAFDLYSSSLIAQGSKIIAAYFKGLNQLTLTRLNSDGSTDISFGINGTSVTTVPFYSPQPPLAISGNRLYVSGQRNTAAFKLTASNNLACPKDTSVYTDRGICSAIVNGIDPITTAGDFSNIIYILAGATTGSGTGSASGVSFNKGVTTVTYSEINNPANTCSFTVTVQDNEPPVITNPLAHPNMLWPPNHQMKDVEIHYELSDNCGATAMLTVTSNESQSGNDGDDIPVDWEIINEHYIKLRAERKGNGEGRTYTVTIHATDAAGNKSTKTVLVKVPHNAGGKPEISIKTFPNPTNTYFNITSPNKDLERVNIRVYNSMGRIIETITGVSLSRNVNFGANYQPGNYTVEVFNSSFSEKLLLVKLPR